ncbi:MAG: hypothetical protein M3066_20135 [Actinomycetota bacterium]|nr:hypothetical protein [Actinomycetota bacterium]
MTRTRVPTAAVLGVQAFLGGVVGLALVAAAGRHPRRGLGGAGLFTLVVAGGLVAVAFGVVRALTWARPVGLTIEGLIALGALTRIGVRPGVAILNLAVAVAAALLLVRSGGATAPVDPGARQGPTAEEDPG